MKTYMRCVGMQQIGIAEIQRNLHKLKDFDIVEIVDKKRNRVKGYYLDKKYIQLIQTLIKQQKKSNDCGEKLAGSLHAYASNASHKQEKTAWLQHLKEKHQQ